MDKNWIWFHDHFGKGEMHLHGITKWLAEAETPFQHIEIGISPYFGKIVLIDGDVQSSITDEYIYHEALVHPAMLSHPNPKNVLILGGGEGATLRDILKHKSVERVVMCDIDRIAIELFKEHLPEWHQGAFKDPRTELIHGDARAYLDKASDGEFDVIISDLTEPYAGGLAQRLFSVECFAEIKRVLSPEGIYTAQASLLRLKTYEMHLAIKRTAETSLPFSMSYATYVQAYDTPWSFLMAWKNPSKRIDISGQIDKLISERIKGEVRFYDEETHRHIFSLPKDVRELLRQPYEPIIDNKPFILVSKSKDI